MLKLIIRMILTIILIFQGAIFLIILLIFQILHIHDKILNFTSQKDSCIPDINILDNSRKTLELLKANPKSFIENKVSI